MKSTEARPRAVWLLALAGLTVFAAAARADVQRVSVLVYPFKTSDPPAEDRCHLDKWGGEQLHTAIQGAAEKFLDLDLLSPEREALNDVLGELAKNQTLSPDKRGLAAAEALKTQYIIFTTYRSIFNSDQCRVDARWVNVSTKANFGSRGKVFQSSDPNSLESLGHDLVLALRRQLGKSVASNNAFRLVVGCFATAGNGSASPDEIKAVARDTTIASLSVWRINNLKVVTLEDSYCAGNLAVTSQSDGGAAKEVMLFLIGKITTFSVGNTIKVQISIQIYHGVEPVAAIFTTVDENRMLEITETVSKLVAELKKQVADPTFMQTEGGNIP